MLERIIDFSIKNKLIVVLFTLTIALFGIFAVFKIPVGAVPDITNNQIQVITTSGNLSTQEIEQFITSPIEMEMANLPGVEEIRSISKFGISVVTIVFKEKMGTYLPRQLLAEKLKSASEIIPEEYGTPEMGPISTGLGEIYQYIVDVEPGYEDHYSPMELRTIQDWIIKRRLSGINGVVEINSWGGYLKQYEVALKPELLNSFNISITEVYNALLNNNNITGGSYIEKNNQSYFIRGEGNINSLEDIKNIRVRVHEGTPLLIKHIADVGFGYANRYGAITANGKGETVLGQIMMLKNANSKEVITEVKRRVEEVQENLPEGVFINPVLERSELISKTTKTVAENLILGAIIVMLTVILLLGNVRSALVIASVIPLALLFTISMMYVFGIDANLMSLGALDFGIIIDGAVIIVEYIAIKITLNKDKLTTGPSADNKLLMDKIAFDGASNMMKSAIFGQVIILIVFIPILSLTGVEGKMFHPMALSFSFAIIGAMILGLTWLPVASSLFLKPEKSNKKNVSKWVMEKIYRSYFPVLVWSCTHKRIVLGTALLALVLTAGIFLKMGGEFVPTLDEGDYVIQPVLKTGTSLSKTVETTTRMENVLIDSFPDEVEQIVCRIGAAEVPTDPMSMEEIDMIIKLKPKNKWKKASNKEELADKFTQALSIIPGIELEFTQPIEMRFNELITGVRSDIAVKVFGDDLDYINEKASEIKDLIDNVPGASDVILEKTTGLPQIKVNYKRKKLAFYDLDINTLNNYISTAFGGRSCGVVFEGEKRFDLVLRFNKEYRSDIDNIKHLMVPVGSDLQIPLTELASIEYTTGPAKISRDNARRRVVVSVNVRNRDLQSVIEDIKEEIKDNIVLSPGNYIEYGGQFKNLQSASRRLMLAVPVALLLIFIFLHFAFKSLKDALMIFTAIPLATVGGVILLRLRGMPFSVSAGIGFIALFGIAVLNGIVLIERLKELQKTGKFTMREVIVKGTKDRLRPVVLTASAAAMGFLPMAISTGAGAEVQRPLATVVIGGLVSSTMLTLIALPLLFEIFYNVIGMRFFPLKFIRSKPVKALLLLIIPSALAVGQVPDMTLQNVMDTAMKNNRKIAAAQLLVDQAIIERKSTFEPDKTLLKLGADQNNLAENGYPLYVFGIEQGIDFPGLYAARRHAFEINIAIAETKLKLDKYDMKKQVSIAYFHYQLLLNKLSVYSTLDSLFAVLQQKTEIQSQYEDVNYLEVLNIRAKRNQLSLRLGALRKDTDNAYHLLQSLMNYKKDFHISDSLKPLPHLQVSYDTFPVFQLFEFQKKHHNALVRIEKNKAAPDFTLEYFLGTNTYDDAKYYQGFEIGVAIPLFFGSHQANIKSAKISSNSYEMESEFQIGQLLNKIAELENNLNKYYSFLLNYQTQGNELYQEIIRTALVSYNAGSIAYYEFVISYESALEMQLEYLENLYNYNRTACELQYFTE
jgi:cobalt-zinc-cadmium resistance protein CzcA